MKKNISYLYWIMAFSLISVLLLGCAGGAAQLKKDLDHPLKEISLGSLGSTIKISVPFDLVAKSPVNLPDSVKQFYLSQENYSGYNQQMSIEVFVMQYNRQSLPKDWNPSIDGAADGSAQKVSARPDVKNFRSSKKHTTVSGLDAVSSSFYYQEKGTNVVQKSLIFTEEDFLWAVTCRCKEEDKISNATIDEVIKSISMKRL